MSFSFPPSLLYLRNIFFTHTNIIFHPVRQEPWLAPAAAALRRAQFLSVHSGAGMGVDSGLPDFRGPQVRQLAKPARGPLEATRLAALLQAASP